MNNVSVVAVKNGQFYRIGKLYHDINDFRIALVCGCRLPEQLIYYEDYGHTMRYGIGSYTKISEEPLYGWVIDYDASTDCDLIVPEHDVAHLFDLHPMDSAINNN